MFFNFYNYFLSIKFLANSKVKIIILQKKLLSWQFKLHLEGPLSNISKEIKKLPKTTGIFLSLELKDIVLKQSQTKIKNNKHIRSATTFQIEPNLPCSAEESAIQIIVRPDGKHFKNVLAFITRKEKIETLVTNTKQLSCFLDNLSVSTIDSIYLVNKILPETKHKTFYMIQMNHKECCCFLIKNNLPLANRSFFYTKNEERNFLEIKHTFAHFQTKNPEIDPEFILSWNLPLKLKQILEHDLKTPIQLLTKPIFIKNLSQDIWEETGDMIATILQGAENREINFLKNSKSFPLIIKNQIKKFFPSFFKIGFLFVILYSLINIFQVRQLKKNAKFSFNLLEKQFQLPQVNCSYSANEIINNLNQHKEFLNNNNKSPLVPNIPKLSEIITWLSSNKNTSSLGFSIDSLNYKMEKHPNKQNNIEKYLAKITLKGSLNDPKLGKTLLKTLKYANPYKNPQKPLEWEQKGSSFSVSFYLQDKTPY